MRSKLLVLFSAVFIGVRPLVLKEVDIPRVVPLGSSPTLKCKINPDSKLKYIKWYKDDQEFCVYSLTESKIQIRTASLHVEDVKCDMGTVKLKKVSLETSGTYKCEATAQHQSVMSSRNMSVMIYPTPDPVITGLMPDYRGGELIHANCTASPSNPPPKLTWFINGILADKYMVHEYTEAVDPGGLYKRALGLKMTAKEEMFTGPGQTLYLVCVVTLPGFPPWKAMANPKIVLPPSSAPIMIESTTEIVFNLTTMSSKAFQTIKGNFFQLLICQNVFLFLFSQK